MLERGVVVCVCMYAGSGIQSWFVQAVEYRVGLCRQWKGWHSGARECDDRSGNMMSRSMCVCMYACACVWWPQCER